MKIRSIIVLIVIALGLFPVLRLVGLYLLKLLEFIGGNKGGNNVYGELSLSTTTLKGNDMSSGL